MQNEACRKLTRVAALAVAVLGAGSLTTRADGVRRALLIGCTEFPEMKKLYGDEGYSGIRLAGPANDVAALRAVLTEKWRFDAANIVTLTGWDETAETTRPTRMNIQKAFEKLAADAGKDDVVVIYLASHCPQLPVPPDPAAEAERDKTRAGAPASTRTAERDGYDEVFLPADAGAMDWENRKVANGIFDHELATWLQRLRDREAFVFAIVNTPHAAGLLDASPEILLNTPSRDDTPKGQGRVAGFVALYSCHADESGAEMSADRGPAGNQKPYGAFAWALCEALRKDETREWSYRQFATAVLEACKGQGGKPPIPASEGELDRKVLSGTNNP